MLLKSYDFGYCRNIYRLLCRNVHGEGRGQGILIPRPCLLFQTPSPTKFAVKFCREQSKITLLLRDEEFKDNK